MEASATERLLAGACFRPPYSPPQSWSPLKRLSLFRHYPQLTR